MKSLNIFQLEAQIIMTKKSVTRSVYELSILAATKRDRDEKKTAENAERVIPPFLRRAPRGVMHSA
jgi:hypothetical protein